MGPWLRFWLRPAIQYNSLFLAQNAKNPGENWPQLGLDSAKHTCKLQLHVEKSLSWFCRLLHWYYLVAEDRVVTNEKKRLKSRKIWEKISMQQNALSWPTVPVTSNKLNIHQSKKKVYDTLVCYFWQGAGRCPVLMWTTDDHHKSWHFHQKPINFHHLKQFYSRFNG